MHPLIVATVRTFWLLSVPALVGLVTQSDPIFLALLAVVAAISLSWFVKAIRHPERAPRAPFG
jgi:putative effector of murein hydrolase LrgA (UPF0299 family)